jgi:hypothetical protein
MLGKRLENFLITTYSRRQLIEKESGVGRGEMGRLGDKETREMRRQ